MKKLLVIMLSLILTLTVFTACGQKEETAEETVKKTGALSTNGEFSIGFPGVEFVCYDDLNSMIMALEANKIDEIGRLPKVVADYITNHNDELKLVTPPAADGSLSLMMAVNKDDADNLEILDSAIKELTDNGTIEKLTNDYVNAYLENGQEPEPVEIPKFDGAKTIKVTITGDLPPIDYIGADGTPAGFNVALLAEIAKLKGVNIELINVSSGSRLLSVTEGKADAMFYVSQTHVEGSDEVGVSDTPKELAITMKYFECPTAEIEKK